MSMRELFVIALGLSMDAFAVAICKGLSMKRMSWKNAVITGLYFGGFQAGMPLIGYFLGTSFRDLITSIDHWIAFGLFLILGINMIKESFSKNKPTADLNFKTMFTLSLATSIDSLMLGITLSLLEFSIFPSTAIIVCCTLISVVIGSIIGYKFGTKYKKISNIIGGIILILMGIKVLIEHLL